MNKNNMNTTEISHGFVATTAVILLAAGTLAFSLAVLSSAALYADSVSRRELRIQADLNAYACADSAALMAAKDYFLTGSVYIPEFACNAVISRSSGSGNGGNSGGSAGDVMVSVEVSVELEGVGSQASRSFDAL